MKHLYDKAHKGRDGNTRTEDQLPRFLDSLRNEQAQFHVEYIKEPQDIDDKVFELVNFIETRQRAGKSLEVLTRKADGPSMLWSLRPPHRVKVKNMSSMKE